MSLLTGATGLPNVFFFPSVEVKVNDFVSWKTQCVADKTGTIVPVWRVTAICEEVAEIQPVRECGAGVCPCDGGNVSGLDVGNPPPLRKDAYSESGSGGAPERMGNERGRVTATGETIDSDGIDKMKRIPHRVVEGETLRASVRDLSVVYFHHEPQHDAPVCKRVAHDGTLQRCTNINESSKARRLQVKCAEFLSTVPTTPCRETATFPSDTPPINFADTAEELVSVKNASVSVPTLFGSHFPQHITHAPPHIIINGENYLTLAVLAATHTNAIDTIYIDPPYNTGNTHFTYHDARASTSHEEWLSFMEPRLVLARDLLKSTGTILISIDDREYAHLKILCDTIFGTQNYVGTVVWDGGATKNNARFLSTTHEYCLIYHKNTTATLQAGIRWRYPRAGYTATLNEYRRLRDTHHDNYEAISAGMKTWFRTANVPPRLKVFTYADARGLYTPSDLSAPAHNTRNSYTITHPTTGKPCTPPSRGWGYREEKIQQLIEDDRIIFGADETKQPLQKLYLHEKPDTVQNSVLSYPARTTTHHLAHLLGEKRFTHPKNVEYITHLLRLTTPRDGVILDFFAGSGTTAHATINLNAEDGGTRQTILITNNEVDQHQCTRLLSAGYLPGDPEWEQHGVYHRVTKPRLTAVATGHRSDGTPHKHGKFPTSFQFCELALTPLNSDDTFLSDPFGVLGG